MLAFTKSSEDNINEERIVNQIRALGLDMIHEANSGHPGIVLGAASIIYTVYAHHLRFSKDNPIFFNRDRFVMSAGHGSALLYATLAMAGFNIEIDDLKKFRQIDSITPGHPEYGVTPGVDVTTGPLGQGVAMAVGMAIAEKHSEALINDKKNNVIDYKIYCLCGDGDLMEGVSYEALSLAGTLKLNNLILLYDSNHVCLDSDTKKVFTDDIEVRFKSMGFNVSTVNDDIVSIDKAIKEAKTSDLPTLIQVKTTIGKYSKNAGKNIVHGRPLDDEDISSIKGELNVRDIPFTVSNEALEDFQKLINDRCANLVNEFNQKCCNLDDKTKELLDSLMNDDKKIELSNIDYTYSEDKDESLREASGKILNSLANSSKLIFGGAADLSSSTLTYLTDKGDFSRDDYNGRNIFFGVREFAMAAIANGLALSGYRPFVSTYLSFSDYLKPALRLTCLMNLPVTYIFTHDSITVGEDGPTHQAVEQLVGLRATPNIEVFRPCDSNEVIGTYKTIFEHNKPACIVLGRNRTRLRETSSVSLVANGAYVIKYEERKLDGIIIATGEEVDLAFDVTSALFEKGYDFRIVSMPSLERFNLLNEEEKELLLPVGIKKFIIEKSSSYSWYSFAYNNNYLFTVDKFGLSGKATDINTRFNFTKDDIALKIEEIIK